MNAGAYFGDISWEVEDPDEELAAIAKLKFYEDQLQASSAAHADHSGIDASHTGCAPSCPPYARYGSRYSSRINEGLVLQRHKPL